MEGRTAPELGEAHVEVQVEDKVASEGSGSFRRAHAADGEGRGGQLVPEGDQVGRRSSKQGHDHIAGDAPLVVVGPAQDAGQAPGEAGVAQVALDRGDHAGVAVAGYDGVR